MASGKSFSDYRHFVRRYAQFSKVFYLSQSLLPKERGLSSKSQEVLCMLNKRRTDAQRIIAELNSSLSSVCADCKGECCRGSYDHFTYIDYWLRRYSESPLQTCGTEGFVPFRQSLLKRFGLHDQSNDKIGRNGCTFLHDGGCRLAVTDRPIRCVAFTCSRLRRAMDTQKHVMYGRLIRDLFLTSVCAFNILKEEADFPTRYGYLSLLVTP